MPNNKIYSKLSQSEYHDYHAEKHKSKGKKLTKAERVKFKREEQERREREEEEERVRQLEDDKKKKIEEKLLAIERQKAENEERKIRRQDMSELMELIMNIKNELQSRDDRRRKATKWARYMCCDGSPDPAVQREINTYISIQLERREAHGEVEVVLRDIQLDLAVCCNHNFDYMLISELEFLLLDTPLEDLSDMERHQYRETIGELQHVIQTELNKVTLRILCEASALQDPETNNLQYCLPGDTVTLCLWGNLNKNPRIKSFDFSEAGISFDIPRVLTLTDCAVRYLHMSCDHFSPYSKSFYPRHKTTEMVKSLSTSAKSFGEPDHDETIKRNSGDVEEHVEEDEPEKEDTMDLLAALRKKVNGEDVDQKSRSDDDEEGQEELENVMEQDFDYLKTPDPPEWEDFDEEDDIVDLRAYHVVGGVFSLDLLDMPPQPKVCDDWIITQLVSPPDITFLDYAADPPVIASQENGKEKEPERDKRDERPPINVTLSLPRQVLFLEEPQVARWDSSRQHWRVDGFSNYSYDEDNGSLKVSISRFGLMCLLQDAHVSMPFQSWQIRPRRLNAAILTIISAIVELEIEIQDGLCRLSHPSDRSELTHLLDRWLTPRQLIPTLRLAGVNVFPEEDSANYVTVQNKNAMVLGRIYDQMGLVASSMAFSWSRWNSEVSEDTIIMQGTEALCDEPLLEEEWCIFMANKHRFAKLKMTEFDEHFCDDMHEDMRFKSNLYHYCQCNGSEESKERTRSTLPEFVDCVQQVLKSVQLLTYS